MSGTQHPRCPFYPASCANEFHSTREGHKWRATVTSESVAKDVATKSLHVANKPVTHAAAALVTQPVVVSDAVSDVSDVSDVTKQSTVTNNGSADRMKKWRAAHAEENRTRQRDLMRQKRAKP